MKSFLDMHTFRKLWMQNTASGVTPNGVVCLLYQ